MKKIAIAVAALLALSAGLAAQGAPGSPAPTKARRKQ
jgi:hypothetical protein